MSARIFQHALQFYELAELAWSNDLHVTAPYAVVANYAFSVEIILKSLSPKQFEHSALPPDDDSDHLIGDVPIASTLRGHPLRPLLAGIDDSIKSAVADKYQLLCDHSLYDDIETCSLYFEKGRYAFEMGNSISFDLTAVRRLSRHLYGSVISNAEEIDALLAGKKFSVKAQK